MSDIEGMQKTSRPNTSTNTTTTTTTTINNNNNNNNNQLTEMFVLCSVIVISDDDDDEMPAMTPSAPKKMKKTVSVVNCCHKLQINRLSIVC